MATPAPRGLHRLTVRQVKAALDGDLADGGGLLLRVAGASASWVLRYTAPTGRRREMGLGRAERGSLDQAGKSLRQAREAAEAARELLARGRCPLDERDASAAAALAREADRSRAERCLNMTLLRAARDYHERAVEPRRTARHSAQWIASIENHLPAALLGRPIGSLSAPELLAALVAAQPHERARRPGNLAETVQRIRQRLEAVFDDAEFHGWCTGNPARSIRRRLSEQGPQSQPAAAEPERGLRALPYARAPEFMRALGEATGTAARALEFLVLCAARTSEVLGARWSEFDLAAAEWRVPPARMKARRAHVVPLSARAVEIVLAQRGQDAVLVFPSPMTLDRADGERQELSNMALLATLDRLGWRTTTTTHGLRATFSTWANETAAARPDVVEHCLAHVEADAVRRAYMRSTFAAERRELLQRWADYLATPAAQALRIA